MTLLHKLDRPNRVWFAISGVMVLVIAALVLTLFALSRANDANSGLHGGCGFLRGVATAPVTPTTSALGLQIVQQARYWYQAADCPGQLPTPDPALAKVH